MSNSTPKINSKNLHYDDTLPPFLARLRANQSNSDGRHEYTVARAKKERTAEDIADDEPVYFDEGSGETLTRGEWEAREKEREEEGKGIVDGAEGGVDVEGREAGEGKEKIGVAAIGGARKRKAGKFVGGEDEDAALPAGRSAGEKAETIVVGEKAGKGKPSKKAKKVKLSFGDDE